MSISIEDLKDQLDTVQNHLINLESNIEDMRNHQPEMVEMNVRDREAVLSNIRYFEAELSDSIKEAFVGQSAEMKSDLNAFLGNLNRERIQYQNETKCLLERASSVAASVKSLGDSVHDEVKNGFDGLNIRGTVDSVMKAHIADVLKAQMKASEQAVIKLVEHNPVN